MNRPHMPPLHKDPGFFCACVGSLALGAISEHYGIASATKEYWLFTMPAVFAFGWLSGKLWGRHYRRHRDR